jgi:hypothetical protein
MNIPDISSIPNVNGKNNSLICLDKSYFELLFVSKKFKSPGQGVSVKSKRAKLDESYNINFSNSKIEFMSINIDEDYIDVFLLHNNNKIKSKSEAPNYYRIIAKDIGVKDTYQEIKCKIVNDIEITINIKFKNKFSTQAISVKDRLKFFNQQKEQKKPVEQPQYVPKKIKMPVILQKDNQKKEEEVKKPIVIHKKVEETKIKEEHKNVEENKKVEEIEGKKEEIIEEQQNIEKEEEKNEELNNEENEVNKEPQNEEKEIDDQNEKKEMQESNQEEEKNIKENTSIQTQNPKNENEEGQKPEIKPKQSKEISNPKEEVKKLQTKQKLAKAKETPAVKFEKSSTISQKIEEFSNKGINKMKTFQIPSTKENLKNKNKTTKPSESEDGFEVIDEDYLDDTSRKTTKASATMEPLNIFLESAKYSQYLDEQKKKGIKNPYRETFCEGFFIASFPKKEGKVIEMSTSFPAPCQHEECSKLPAMKPEIIFRYPLKDTKTLELNNLAATICFPTGIKVCYDENSGPKEVKDYVTSITNQKGERYYMMTYHFYLKLECDDYVKKYDENPLKYNLRKFADAYTGLSEEELTEEKINIIQENLEFSQELGFRDYVFVPFCICLISKYPFVQEMQKCLKTIYTIIKKGNNADGNVLINELIMYLINAIPIPAKNTRIRFLLPFYNNSIDIDCPKLEDINIMNLSSSWLLKYFNIENLVILFRLLISEKKILLIDNDYERLSAVADGLVSILYPFQWIHTFIPIMSDQMLKYLETFLPFLNGINESLMDLVEKIFKEGEVEEDDEVFLVYIKENKIKLSSTLKGQNKKFDKYIQDNIPSLPPQLEKELKSKLKKAKYELDDIEKNKKKNTSENRQNCELQIRDAFIDLFVEMFQDYAKYLSFVEEDPVFNKSLFLEKKPNNEKAFYNEILDTQLFQQFTQNVVNEDVNYFNNKITLHELGKKAKQKKNLKAEKEYYISPEFLHLQKINEDTNIKDLIKELKEKYPEETKNTSTILENDIEIEEAKYDENNLLIFFTPEEVLESEPTPLVDLDMDVRNPRKMTNSNILQKFKAMNLKMASNLKKKEGLSDKEKDMIKETIKDYVVKIFRSEDFTLEQKEKTDLLNKLNDPFGREFFINLLMKNSSNVILLKDNSFHLLWYLIYMPLISTLKIEETDKVLEDIVHLIKCTTYFGIQEDGQTKTLFEKYIAKIQDLPKIKQDNFWEKWYELELKKNEKLKDDIEFKQSIIYDICNILLKLEMPKSYVKRITDTININEFGKGTDLQQETFKEIIKLLSSARYISSVKEI